MNAQAQGAFGFFPTAHVQKTNFDDGPPALLLCHQEFRVQFSLRHLKEGGRLHGGRPRLWEVLEAKGTMEDVRVHPDGPELGDASFLIEVSAQRWCLE